MGSRELYFGCWSAITKAVKNEVPETKLLFGSCLDGEIDMKKL